MKNFISLHFIFLFINLLSGTFAKSADLTQSIILCQSGAFTGASSHFSRQAWLGAQTYFDEVNRSGGINGKKIELRAFDDGYDPAQAVKNTNECLKDTNVFALFNYFGSSPVAEVLPLLKKAREDGKTQAFLFANMTGAELQRKPPYDSIVLNMRPAYREETALIVEHFVSKGAKKIGMFIQSDGFGKSGLDGIRSALEKHKMTVETVAEYKKGQMFTESFKDQASKLKDSQLVVSISTYQAAAGFIRDLRDAGYKGPIAHVSFVGAQDTLDLLKKISQEKQNDYIKNVFVTTAYPPVNQTQIPIVAEYLKLSKKYPIKTLPESINKTEPIKPVSIFGLEGYIDAKTFVEILRKSKSLTPADFLATVNQGFELDLGLKHPIHFSNTDHQGTHEVWMLESHEQGFKIIK